MAIIFSENGKNSVRIDEAGFPLETNLQKLIIDNPETIPLYDISEDLSLLVLAREFQTTSGPIDALGIDMFGNIYVIETKLFKNPDKRYVIAQAIDYGAALWKHTSADDFYAQLNSKSQSHFGMKLEEKISSRFDESRTEEIITNITKNLAIGNVKFVVLMDHLEDKLKDLILYVNQNSQFDIYAVEMKYYKHKEYEILIPALHGANVKKNVVSTSGSNSNNNSQISSEEVFIDTIKQTSAGGGKMTIEQAIRIHDLNKAMVHKTKGRIEYYTSTTTSGSYGKSYILEDKYNCQFNSDGNYFFYVYEKYTPMVLVLRRLIELVVSKNLFGKVAADLKANRLYITPNQIKSTEEVDLFISLFKQALDEIPSNNN